MDNSAFLNAETTAPVDAFVRSFDNLFIDITGVST